MADSEKRDVYANVAQSRNKKYDAAEKQEVIVAGHHMFGAQIEVRPELQTLFALQKVGIAFGHAMSERKRGN